MCALAAIAVLIAIRLSVPDWKLSSGRRYRVSVVKVFDGDTFETATGQRIRLLGVDSPEVQHGDKPGQEHGEEARVWLDSTCQGKTVTVQEGAEPIDRYGRTLAWVYLEDGRLLNEDILATGHAKLMARFGLPLELEERLRKAQADARLAKVGLWALR